MPRPDHRSFWQKCRPGFRRCRIGLWIVLLLLLGALLYLNRVGLPGFLKEPLRGALRARGLDLQFTRLRWRPDRGLVAENVSCGATNLAAAQFTVREAEIQLSYRALLLARLQVDSLILRHGRASWPLGNPERSGREIAVEDIRTELRFLPGDLWQLNQFHAEFAGARFELAGVLSNASAVLDWHVMQPGPATPQTALRDRLETWADLLEDIHFSSPPLLTADLRGDARDLQSFQLDASLNAPDADTPWGTLQRGQLAVHLAPGTRTEWPHANLRLQADHAQTRWGAISNVLLNLQVSAAVASTNVAAARLEIETDGIATSQAQAGHARFNGQWIHSFTNPVPLSGTAELAFDKVRTEFGEARAVQLACTWGSVTNPPAANSADRVPGWRACAPYQADWTLTALDLRYAGLEPGTVTCGGRWLAPVLQVTNLTAGLGKGQLGLAAALDLATGKLRFKGNSSLDLLKLTPALPPALQTWFRQTTWIQPPDVSMEGQFEIPDPSQTDADWFGQILRTLAGRGEAHAYNTTLRGVNVVGIDTHFSASNGVWQVPDLVIRRPEGWLSLVLQTDRRTLDYNARLRSTLDFMAVRPLLPADLQEASRVFMFNQPPSIEAVVRGQWGNLSRLAVSARVGITNFVFRGQTADGFQSSVEYTNLCLKLFEPRLQRAGGKQTLSASSVTVDFAAGYVYLTNGIGTADPEVITRAIGPLTAKAMEPFHFLQPPSARVEGVIPLHDSHTANLHFDIEGGPFEWWKFKLPHLSGQVHWIGDDLHMRNVLADFYHGTAQGSADFDFRPEHGTDFKFDATVNQVDFHSLMSDLLPETNRLEGTLAGQLYVTHANSDDWRTTQGRGHCVLRDGLIWEIPMFGILTPVLDGIIPGLGHSRASAGTADFVITNGVVYTSNFDIQCATMRLHYLGTVDLQGRVDAKADASLLRNTWVVGRVLSAALWPVSKLFEFRITGTLGQPKSQPLYFVPRVLLLPFLPASSREPVFEPIDSLTNAPPK
ncbi:MAG: AsmA-like C-terminal region-containing protein [Verrucomicrobiota bacterium]